MGNTKRISTYKYSIRKLLNIHFIYGSYLLFVFYEDEIQLNTSILEELDDFINKYQKVSKKNY